MPESFENQKFELDFSWKRPSVGYVWGEGKICNLLGDVLRERDLENLYEVVPNGPFLIEKQYTETSDSPMDSPLVDYYPNRQVHVDKHSIQEMITWHPLAHNYRRNNDDYKFLPEYKENEEYYSYNQSEDHNFTLFARFADLEPTEDNFLQWANKYGRLTNANEWWNPKVVYVKYQNQCLEAEPLSFWIQEHSDLSFTVLLWEWLNDKNSKYKLEELIRLRFDKKQAYIYKIEPKSRNNISFDCLKKERMNDDKKNNGNDTYEYDEYAKWAEGHPHDKCDECFVCGESDECERNHCSRCTEYSNCCKNDKDNDCKKCDKYNICDKCRGFTECKKCKKCKTYHIDEAYLLKCTRSREVLFGFRKSFNVLQETSRYIKNQIYSKLNDFPVNVRFRGENPSQKIFMPTSLLSAMWYQLYLAMSGEIKLRRCSECGEWVNLVARYKNWKIHKLCATNNRVEKHRAKGKE